MSGKSFKIKKKKLGGGGEKIKLQIKTEIRVEKKCQPGMAQG